MAAANGAKGNPAAKRMMNQSKKSKRIRNKARNDKKRANADRFHHFHGSMPCYETHHKPAPAPKSVRVPRYGSVGSLMDDLHKILVHRECDC